MSLSDSIRRQVAERACNRCEYCGLSEVGQAATFHLDHIVPSAAGGPSTIDNLAYACVHCSLRKGARQLVLDPATDVSVPLFHPRQHVWNTHYRWSDERLVGLTPIGRGTIEALNLNSHEHQIIRSFETILQRHPPPGQF
jgi:hypothetical protein